MQINSKPHIHQNVICSNVFVKKDDKYLMIERSLEKTYAPGFLSPVGGKVDENENPFQAAKREVLEESGLIVDNLKLEAIMLEVDPEKEGVNWLINEFVADYMSGELIDTVEGKLVWLTKAELIANKERMFPSLKKLINNILDPNDGTIFATFHYDDNQQIIESKSTIDICLV
jgi:8-oxo-dGTP diphosphatase